jgi:hypothetical protein
MNHAEKSLYHDEVLNIKPAKVISENEIYLFSAKRGKESKVKKS